MRNIHIFLRPFALILYPTITKINFIVLLNVHVDPYKWLTKGSFRLKPIFGGPLYVFQPSSKTSAIITGAMGQLEWAYFPDLVVLRCLEYLWNEYANLFIMLYRPQIVNCPTYAQFWTLNGIKSEIYSMSQFRTYIL